MARKKHIHKYHRINLKFHNVWACALPDCNHFMPHYLEDSIIGKFSICWSCNEPFILNPMNMQNEMPVCESCNAPKELLDDLENLLERK